MGRNQLAWEFPSLPFQGPDLLPPCTAPVAACSTNPPPLLSHLLQLSGPWPQADATVAAQGCHHHLHGNKALHRACPRPPSAPCCVPRTCCNVTRQKRDSITGRNHGTIGEVPTANNRWERELSATLKCKTKSRTEGFLPQKQNFPLTEFSSRMVS